MDANSLIVLVVLALLAYYVWLGQGAKELAHRAAKAYCNKAGVQFLDDSVVIRGLTITRDRNGQLCFRRRYDFEFASTGDRRYKGKVVLLGRMIADIELEAHRVDEPAQPTLH